MSDTPNRPSPAHAAPSSQSWTVSGMDCAACAARIKTAVGRLPGVSDVELGVMSERLQLTLDPAQSPPEAIEKTVRGLGYGITPRSGAKPDTSAVPKLVRPNPANQGQDTACHDSCCSAPAPSHPHDHSQHQDHHHHQDHQQDAMPGSSAPVSHAGDGHLHGAAPEDRDRPWYLTQKGKLVMVTGGVLALAWLAKFFLPEAAGPWVFTLACLIGLVPVAKRAYAALRAGEPFTIEGLMTIAAAGALVIGASEEAALVVFLFAVGEVLEGVAAGRARQGIRALSALVPKTALLLDPARPEAPAQEIDAQTLAPGQLVLVRPGDRIPADGEIFEGTSGIDESPVTGESVPVTRGPGEPVYAGAINTEAVLKVRVTKAASDNTISRIIALVEEAETARAPTERFIDRFSRWYMPTIVALAALVVLVPPLAFGADWQTWVYRGLSLLLIGCPCALVISVPASIASALSAGARRGLLMKGGAVIEAAAGVKNVCFDKTGTLTHGRPVVTDVVALAGSEAEALAMAAAVEAGSSHPLAQAISREAETRGLALPAAERARAIVGRGVSAEVSGHEALVSSPKHAASEGGLDDAGLERAAELEREGKTAVVVSHAGRALGLIAMRDEPRADAADAVRQLSQMGVGATVLTGDNPRTAQAIAEGLGMSWKAEMLPQDKLTAIRELAAKGGVMMIGDGINDAPALKQADVGVAMGSGTDVALETADAAILRDRVSDVAATLRLSRAAMANIRQNVGLALGLKGVFLVTSVLGITGLWPAIMADTGATVLVTLNALRLLRFNPEEA